MKTFRRVLFILIFAVLAALGVIFWPKIRECCDRWLAGGQTEDENGGKTISSGERS